MSVTTFVDIATEIISWRIEKIDVKPGETITYAGRLQRIDNHLGVADATLSIQYVGVDPTIWTHTSTAITDANGDYNGIFIVPATGMKKVRTAFAGGAVGQLTYMPTVSNSIVLGPFWISNRLFIPLTAGLGAAVLVYFIDPKRRLSSAIVIGMLGFGVSYTLKE